MILLQKYSLSKELYTKKMFRYYPASLIHMLLLHTLHNKNME